MNKVFLAGRITSEIARFGTEAKAGASFTLVTSKPVIKDGVVQKDGNGYTETWDEFHTVKAFGGLAKSVVAHKKKGDQLIANTDPEFTSLVLDKADTAIGGFFRGVDLSDPAKRTDADISAAMKMLGELDGAGLRVMLGLNLSEAQRIAAVRAGLTEWELEWAVRACVVELQRRRRRDVVRPPAGLQLHNVHQLPHVPARRRLRRRRRLGRTAGAHHHHRSPRRARAVQPDPQRRACRRSQHEPATGRQLRSLHGAARRSRGRWRRRSVLSDRGP